MTASGAIVDLPSGRTMSARRAARLIAGYGVVVCAAPYLVLKMVWLAGGQFGVADPAMMRDPSIVALNVLTMVMDVVAIAIAMAFTHELGSRVPAWLVLPPIWLATGLLTRFVIGVPAALIAQMIASDAIRAPLKTPVHSWVYVVVYTAFMGMGVGLTLAFVLYARTRWSTVLASHAPRAGHDSTYGVTRPLANMAAGLAAGVAMLHLAWAAGSTVGLSGSLAAQRSVLSYLLNAIDAGVAIAAAIGILAIVHGSARIPFSIALTLTWIGGSYLCAWGLWHIINVLGNTAFVRDTNGMALFNLVSLARFVAGLFIGVLPLFVISEHRSADWRP